MSDFLRQLTCPHNDTTPPDGSGRAICGRCGSLVRVGPLRLTDLQLACDEILYGVSFRDAWGNRIDPKDVHAGPTNHQGRHHGEDREGRVEGP